jgi:hypothetical protein
MQKYNTVKKPFSTGQKGVRKIHVMRIALKCIERFVQRMPGVFGRPIVLEVHASVGCAHRRDHQNKLYYATRYLMISFCWKIIAMSEYMVNQQDRQSKLMHNQKMKGAWNSMFYQKNKSKWVYTAWNIVSRGVHTPSWIANNFPCVLFIISFLRNIVIHPINK